ncbi:UBX domain-containing protein 7-like [Haliotis rufescens]|uniref:UBX domain-containing protein 7-like n=1 Tax=Haliotis rufescens TaxID=6454 RepID=UPI001EB08AA0|nr:UBX domain-containing protein 7-like [Haliotis rufescens]
MAEPREDENIVDDSKIEQFCAVTGSSSEAAKELLRVCCGNLEMAIGMHMDGSCEAAPAAPCPLYPDDSLGHSSTAGASADVSDSDAVRAPIPQRREVLVEEAANLGFRPRRRQTRSVFDGFRDFQAEARQQEQRLASTQSGVEGGGGGGGNKQRTLEDLFRPPIDLTYKGTFQNARDTGTRQNKWLLVNVQNVQEFPCQVLNRDIWSCPHIRNLIKQHFIFWQVYHDSEEGKKYMQFYKINEWPYVSIVDPRTGENLAEWSKIMSASAMRTMFSEFLLNHQNPDSADSSPPSKRLKREPSIVDASEEDQLKAAIEASLKQEASPQEDSCIFVDTDSEAQSDDMETFSDSNEEDSRSEMPSTSKCHKNNSSKEHTKDSKSVNNVNTKSLPGTSKGVQGSVSDGSGGEGCVAHLDKVAGGDCSKGKEGQDKSVNGHQELEEAEEKDDEPAGPEMNLLIRFPDGAKEHLNLPSTSTIKALLKFVVSKGIKSGDFELVTNFPRRQLHLLSPSTKLKDAGLQAKDTLFVHCV